MNRTAGSIALAVNGRDHHVSFGEDETFSSLLNQALKDGHDPAVALRYLAVIGVHVWHPMRNPPQDLLKGWSDFFGEPIGNPNGTLLGSVIVGANGRKFVAPISGGDYYDSHILRAHKRGMNAAAAFLLLANTGARLNQANYSMLGGQQQDEMKRLFRI